MTIKDLKEIPNATCILLSIEREIFPNESFSENQILDMLNSDIYTIWGCFLGTEIMGYEILLNNGFEIELIKIGSKKKGVGHILIENIPNEDIFLEVRASNPAVNFYKNHGFYEINRRKNYYQNEDAIIMKKNKI